MTLKKQVFLLASFFLVLGVACYFFLYPNKFQVVTIGWWRIEAYKIEVSNDILLWVIYGLTSYCHIVFMTFYSLVITDNLTTKAVYQWSIFWGVVDSLFEIGQLKQASSEPSIFDTWPLSNINHYLEAGRFDIGDILFIWLGVLSSIYFWRMLSNKKLSTVTV